MVAANLTIDIRWIKKNQIITVLFLKSYQIHFNVLIALVLHFYMAFVHVWVGGWGVGSAREKVCGSFPCFMLLCKAQLSGGHLNMSQCHASVSVWFYMTSLTLCSPLPGPCLARHSRTCNKEISAAIGNKESVWCEWLLLTGPYLSVCVERWSYGKRSRNDSSDSHLSAITN